MFKRSQVQGDQDSWNQGSHNVEEQKELQTRRILVNRQHCFRRRDECVCFSDSVYASGPELNDMKRFVRNTGRMSLIHDVVQV